jgi:hypothetical protein
VNSAPGANAPAVLFAEDFTNKLDAELRSAMSFHVDFVKIQ